MSDYPIKDCDYCEHVGKAYTSRDGETICEACLSKYPTSSRDCRMKIQELERRLDEAEKVTQWNRDNMIHPAQILTIVEDFDSNEKNGYSYDTLFHYFMDAIQKLCKTGN